MTRYEHLLLVASRLGQVEVSSEAADRAIHAALGRNGPLLPYTTDEPYARTLLPPGFEWMDVTPTDGGIYAPCRRTGLGADGLAYPHHGQWGRTQMLSMCGGALRVWAMLAQMEKRRSW